MTIKNISSKVIGVGTTVLMPDQKLPNASAALVNTAAVQALIGRGFLSVDDDGAKQREFDEAVKKATEEALAKKAAEDTANETAENEPVKPATRKRATDETAKKTAATQNQ